MALVTSHQRTTSSSSTRSDESNSDTHNADHKDTPQVTDSRIECQSTSAVQRTAALMLGSNERLRASCVGDPNSVGSTDSNIHNATDTRAVGPVPTDEQSTRSHAVGMDTTTMMATMATTPTTDGNASTSRPTSSCSSGSSSSSSDIQQHLQSMFCLLRPEETLKMAVKLESLRPGRTRYLVVVSRTVTSKRHNTGTLYPASSGNTSSLWPLSATPAPITTTITSIASSSQQSSRPCSAMSGPGIAVTSASSVTSTVAHTPHGSCTSETFASINDKFVTSLDNCALSAGIPTDSCVRPTCRSDQCDNKTSSRLSSSTAAGTESAEHVCTEGLTIGDERDCSNGSDTSGCDPGHVGLHQPHSIGGGTTTDGGKKIEESCLLGIDCNERTTVGLVLKVLADTSIRLDGDGGFSVSSCGKQHIFKPVSVQAMWSALQTLHKASFKAREHNFFAGGPSHDWVAYYEAHIDSDRSCLNEWNAMDSLESRRPPSPGSVRSKPTEREETESVIRSKLKEVMMSVDLDDVTSKFIRGRLEELLDMDLGEYKPFIDAEMLVILGQMDAPTEIFDHVYLGSEWNASNLEELQRNGVQHILNVTREIDNFFPGRFHYCNVRVYDDEKTDLLRHWDNTFKFISRAKMEGSKVLVHCKMGISRSASVVIAYAMKANGWDFEQALRHVKKKRGCIKPNKNFLMQLETYQGMLDAMKNKEKLQRSKSETNLKLTGAKEGRSLPGSEPTPLIQALNGGAGGVGGGGGKGRPHQMNPIASTAYAGQLESGVDIDAVGGAAATAGTASDLTSEADGGTKLQPAVDGEPQDRAHDPRGRTRTRQTKPLPLYVQQQQQPQQQQQEIQQALQGDKQPAGTPLELSSDSLQLNAKRTLPFPSSSVPAPWNVCVPRPIVHKRHKSLSPESTRWPPQHSGDGGGVDEVSLTSFTVARTLLGLNAVEPVESAVAVTSPTTMTTTSSRRKQQSYSLEHLHGGALEMRSSPCAETKTIRMPCGNGQNYSVSPNQIVHLQDKLPASGVRKAVSSTLVAGNRTKLEDAFNIPKTFGVPSSAPTTTTTMAATMVTVPATETTSTVPLSSCVKTIVSELEWNSICSNSNSSNSTAITTTTTTTSASNIPIAPPPLQLAESGPLPATGAPIPIASVAAEAAAVAVASANRVFGTGTTTEAIVSTPQTNDPVEPAWDQGEPIPPKPICWTSSAQIIQQTSAVECFVAVAGAPCSVGICEGAVAPVAVPVLRQCSWSSCDSSCPPVAMPDDRGEDIPWHPGTVKRTKKRIEERTSGTVKWSGKKSAPKGADERPGMVSTSYARLSASAPDSYNLYAEPGTIATVPTKRQAKLHHQHSFVGAALPGSSSVAAGSFNLVRVSFRGSGAEGAQQSKRQQQQQPSDEETFNAGKVRDLKMSFEAKSTDRRQGQKKVRSLPSSPVAVHVTMGSQGKNAPAAAPATPPSATTNAHPTEDVTVRDLVDRYEVNGPRLRPIGTGTLGSRTQRPRSVFEPLKKGKAYAQSGSLLLSHSTTQLRLDEATRPPPFGIGPLQQHRHIGAASGPGVPGAAGPSATVTANVYNTM
uniref:protein-serine/threonine phosphatase n=1 Tax=Anopheles dirus TaxID=7168 RepID=A0A182N1M7_9DIPT